MPLHVLPYCASHPWSSWDLMLYVNLIMAASNHPCHRSKSSLERARGCTANFCGFYDRACSYFPSARVRIRFRLGSESWTSNHEWGLALLGCLCRLRMRISGNFVDMSRSVPDWLDSGEAMRFAVLRLAFE